MYIQIKTTLLDVDFNFDCRSLDMSDYVINKDQPRPVYKLIAVSVSMNWLQELDKYKKYKFLSSKWFPSWCWTSESDNCLAACWYHATDCCEKVCKCIVPNNLFRL